MIIPLRPAEYFAFERIEVSPCQVETTGHWDLLISAYDESDRVRIPFERVSAERKHWIVHEEYSFSSTADIPDADSISDSFDPPEIFGWAINTLDGLSDPRICIDATGFIRPHLLVLLRAMIEAGISSFDVIYSDPIRYRDDERTKFLTGPVIDVRQVPGYEGTHPPSMGDNDLLIIGAGYDHEQIARACSAKLNCKKFVMTAFPSLQPHMFQESILQLAKADDTIGPLAREQHLFASASNPFSVAQAIHDLIESEDVSAMKNGAALGNLYLCPLGPKPHVLGFAICYLRELTERNASIIYPFASNYSRLTTDGWSRTWLYRVEI